MADQLPDGYEERMREIVREDIRKAVLLIIVGYVVAELTYSFLVYI